MTVSDFSEMVQRQRSKREHPYVEARLPAHLDGELSASDDRLIRDHLGACEERVNRPQRQRRLRQSRLNGSPGR